MESFSTLFGSLLALGYHCFDRIVIQGSLPLLTRPEHIVHVFRDVHRIAPITKEVLIQRTTEYKAWVEAFASDHGVPIAWAEAGVKKEDHVRPSYERFARRRRIGVYFIFRSMEQGPKFHVLPPKAADPMSRLIRRTRGRYTHFYFYIRDDILGPFVMGVGSFLPFQTTYYLNGHHVMAGELERQGICFRRDDHAFLATADADALQAAADRLTAEVIRKRLDYWTRVLGPKFSREDRAAVPLRREYSLNQVESCRNFVFRRHFPIHQIFERSWEMGLFRLTADTVAHIFGVRVHKRLRGKLSCVLDKFDHGHHVMRVYGKSLVARLYEKFSTFLRVEICVNRLKDLGLNKGLATLEALRQTLAAATDRLAGFEAHSLNVHVDVPLFQRIALPVTVGRTRIPGIKIHDPRMIRLMEVLLHAGTQLAGWRTTEIHTALLTTFGLTRDAYSLTQLRYDVRKMKAHGLVERQGRRYCYRLTDKGIRVATMFVLFHKRVCGPLVNTLFHGRPDKSSARPTPIETAYYKADAAIQKLVDLLAA